MPAQSVVQGMRMEMEKMYGQLCACSAQLDDLRLRAAAMLRKREKGEKSFDLSYEADFTRLRTGLRTLNTKADDFYHFAERALKVLRMAPNLAEAGNTARSLAVVSRHFRLELEKLAALQISAKPLFRKMQITLYWWEVDKTLDEMYKESALILAFSKELLEIIADSRRNHAEQEPPQKPE